MKCLWPWSHKWTLWKVTGSGEIRARHDSLGLPIPAHEKRPVIGFFEVQRRYCESCGKSQVREVQT